MKLLLCSPDSLIDNETGDFFDGIEDVLNAFIKTGENKIVVVSVQKESLKKIPSNYNPIPIPGALRGSPKLIDKLCDILGLEETDIIVLGCKDKDIHQAANSKLLLLRAIYAKANNPSSKIYEKKYGIGVKNAEKLALFFSLFDNFTGSWYYELEVDATMTVYALIDANTYMKGASEKEYIQSFQNCLKRGDKVNRGAYMVYFIFSMYLILKDLKDVNYWAIYPSSDSTDNEDLDFFKIKAQQLYNGTSKESLFIRTVATAKRHEKSRQIRIEEGCDSQFDSIILNPYYANKLKGKTICVIDDFTTYGTSAETVRILLTAAGVKKIVFICMGKFGNTYHKYDYSITGDIFDSYTYKQNAREELRGAFKHGANRAFISSLTELLS